MFYPQERLALFIDGANLYAAARALSFDIDYKRLLNLFAQRGRLIRAFYYTALIEDQDHSPIRPLVDWLDYNGYTMITKPTKEYTDAYGRRKVKGNMDIELAIDVMEMCDNVDHIVLFSGDGDFRCLVEAAQRKGVRVTVVSTVRSNPPMVADELRRQADHYMELMELAPGVSRTPVDPDEADFEATQPGFHYTTDIPEEQPVVEGYDPYNLNVPEEEKQVNSNENSRGNASYSSTKKYSSQS